MQREQTRIERTQAVVILLIDPSALAENLSFEVAHVAVHIGAI
jgi:hypothetical protein